MQEKIFSNVASELQEIFKYLDASILEKIPDDLKKHIAETQNHDYSFKLDKNKELIEQDILQETKQILSTIFLKYCCTEAEKEEILQRHREIKESAENKKIGLEELQKIFDNKVKYGNQTATAKEIAEIKQVSWYQKMINILKKFFRIK